MLPKADPGRKPEYKVRIILQASARRRKKTFSGRVHKSLVNMYIQKETPHHKREREEKLL